MRAQVLCNIQNGRLIASKAFGKWDNPYEVIFYKVLSDQFIGKDQLINKTYHKDEFGFWNCVYSLPKIHATSGIGMDLVLFQADGIFIDDDKKTLSICWPKS